MSLERPSLHLHRILALMGGLTLLSTSGVVGQDSLVASNPRWSPDGAWIVFYAGANGQSDIFRQRVADGLVERLTSGPEMDYGPDYSPDGLWLAYYSGSGPSYSIKLLSLDGTEHREVGCGGVYEGNPHFSHDGTRLTFSSNRDGNHEIYVVNLDGSGCRRITNHPGNDWTPRFSPDDSRLVFASDRGGDFSIYTVSVDGGEEPKLVADQNKHDYYPDWSPDGTRLAFFSGPDYEHFEVFVVELRTGSTRQVTTAPWTATNPAWSPDGAYLLVGGSNGSEETLMLVRPDGSDLHAAIRR